MSALLSKLDRGNFPIPLMLGVLFLERGIAVVDDVKQFVVVGDLVMVHSDGPDFVCGARADSSHKVAFTHHFPFTVTEPTVLPFESRSGVGVEPKP